MSQTTSGLCNAVFGRALVPEQENPLNARRLSCVLSLNPSSFCSFWFSPPCTFHRALIEHATLSSPRRLILNSCFALPATEGNKILLLWKLLTERRTAAYETSSEETEAYIWLFPVCRLGGELNLPWKFFLVCLFCVNDGEAVRVTDWWTDRVRRKRRGNRKGVWSLVSFCTTWHVIPLALTELYHQKNKKKKLKSPNWQTFTARLEVALFKSAVGTLGSWILISVAAGIKEDVHGWPYLKSKRKTSEADGLQHR